MENMGMSSSPGQDKERILSVDGLRTVAVLGVTWAHTWLFFGNPKLLLGGIDFSRLISIVGEGVGLFFVISGYCMYLMYGRKVEDLNKASYFNFIKKRWLRIAPAYYAALVVSAFVYFFLHNQFPLKALFVHLLTLNTIIPGTNIIAAPFWSLATEWHFYFLLPLILFLAHKFGTKLIFGLFAFIVLLIRYFTLNDISSYEFYNFQFYNQLISFLLGAFIAYLYINKVTLPRILTGWKGVLLSFLVAYVGRIFMTSYFYSNFNQWGIFFRAVAEPVMTLGFALILWNVVKDNNIFSRILSSKIFVKVGQLSYSLYLWHWYICIAVCYLIREYVGSSFAFQQLAFVLSLAVALPVASVSYRLFESYYFKIHKRI